MMDKVLKRNNSKYDLPIICSFFVLCENNISKYCFVCFSSQRENLLDFVVKQRFSIKFPVDKHGDITIDREHLLPDQDSYFTVMDLFDVVLSTE